MAKPRLGAQFAKLHRLMIFLCKEDIAALGVQVGQTPFLAALLRRENPLTQDELSTILVIDKAATARALDQLEKSGFVRREINPDNRRQKLVSVTPKALEIRDRLFEVMRNVNDLFTEGFTDEEISTLFNLMNRMIENAMKVRYDKCPR